MSNRAPRCFALIPAAGSGSRAGGVAPKQYEQVAGRSVIDRALDAFRTCAAIERTYIVLAPDDKRFDLACDTVVPLYSGGASRRDSVLAALDALDADVHVDDWILVHDAARPGLTHESLARLIDELMHDDVGGLLALPVPDTVKRVDDHARVVSTIPRDGLWLAQTPQMFRYALLKRALLAKPDATDESSAIEALGFAPKVVRGSMRNFKITYREDFEFAARWWI